MRFLRTSEVVARTTLSRSTIWRKEKAGEFRARRRLGANAVGWLEDEVDEWLASRPRVVPSDTRAAEAPGEDYSRAAEQRADRA